MNRKIYIITGKIGAGKTYWLQSFLDDLDNKGIAYAGLLCPGVFANKEKVGIDAVLLPQKEVLHLAVRKSENSGGFSKRWNFDDAVLEKINQHFGQIAKTEYLFVDELGPLELERGEGLTNAVEILKSGNFEKAYVVVRPHLVETAKKMFAKNSVVEVIDIEEKSCFELLLG